MKQHWITHDEKKVGFVATITDWSGKRKKCYITDRKKLFKMGDDNGFSISKGVFKQLGQLGIKDIRVRLMKNGIPIDVYTTTVKVWSREGRDNFYGLDPQLFLKEELFEGRGGEEIG